MTKDSEEVVLGLARPFRGDFFDVELAHLFFLLMPGCFRQRAIGIDAKQHSCRALNTRGKYNHESGDGMGRTNRQLRQSGSLRGLAEGTVENGKKTRQRYTSAR